MIGEIYEIQNLKIALPNNLKIYLSLKITNGIDSRISKSFTKNKNNI